MALSNGTASRPPSRRAGPTSRAAIRARHHSPRTEETYVGWIKRFIFFHNKRHPASMGADEVNAFLSSLAVEGHLVIDEPQGASRLAVQLLYGSGLRLLECLCLRVKDLDFARHEVLVRDPKRRRDRMTMLPRAAETGLRAHLEQARWYQLSLGNIRQELVGKCVVATHPE